MKEKITFTFANVKSWKAYPLPALWAVIHICVILTLSVVPFHAVFWLFADANALVQSIASVLADLILGVPYSVWFRHRLKLDKEKRQLDAAIFISEQEQAAQDERYKNNGWGNLKGYFHKAKDAVYTPKLNIEPKTTAAKNPSFWKKIVIRSVIFMGLFASFGLKSYLRP